MGDFHQNKKKAYRPGLPLRESGDLTCMELGPDLLGKIFPGFSGLHEPGPDIFRDRLVLVHEPGGEFDLQDLVLRIIACRSQDHGFDGLSLHEYRHVLHDARGVKGCGAGKTDLL